jgi:hypothetical protein
LRNPRYLGRETWAKYSGHEVLVDPDDVALGHRKAMRPNTRDRWVLSEEIVHDPIVDPDVFAAAQERIAAGKHRPMVRKRPTSKPYVVRGLVRCGTCGRRMEGSWRHGRCYYLCRLADPLEYARSQALDAEHPRYA